MSDRLDGKTIEQWKYSAELCSVGRYHEWQQMCELTEVISSVAALLKGGRRSVSGSI